MTKKKLSPKAPLHTLTAQLAEVKGGTAPNPGPVEPPPQTDARAEIIELG